MKMSIARENGEVLVRFDPLSASGNKEALRRHIEEWAEGKRVRAEQIESEFSAFRLRISCGNLNEVNACL